ncbi:hypothetical protein OHA40_01375 [Nocardia sp. NBC_00508]|uniref:hypothetical protein n=1 Tax=Nocardia sp. NBC_00508 TaxID=2975992 RepID=UPI002E818807|nr:hypothetical protein [Nocardia sp. NBC_00508]WUD66853.1 hypothetical protein OHA40_01375 [Nocardia sp. NBC_00508]
MSQPPDEQTSTLPTGSAFDGFTHVARSIGQLVAPTTLLTAVLFYFGWAHVYWFFNYFGVDSTTLNPSIREYLMRTVDTLFVPLIFVGLIGMSVLWGYIALPDSIRARQPSRWATTVIAMIAAAVIVNGVSRIYVVTPLNKGLCVAPVSIIASVLVLWLLVVLRRKRLRERRPATAPPPSQAATVAEWAILFTMVGINLFWIATDYSVAVGQTRAREWAAQLPTSSHVIIYSEKDLHLSRSDVRTTTCGTDGSTGSAYRFRYDGLVPLSRIGDHYILVPRTWTRGHGAAIVLPAQSPGAIRFEFRLAGDSAPATC